MSQTAALQNPSPCFPRPTQPMLPQLQTASPTIQPIFPVPPSEFTLIFLHGNIWTCAGCHTPFPKQGNKFADPPFNIAVKHQEDRGYISPINNERKTKYGNAYYHVFLQCIQTKWQSFQPSQLVVSNDIKVKLLASYKQLLQHNFVNLGLLSLWLFLCSSFFAWLFHSILCDTLYHWLFMKHYHHRTFIYHSLAVSFQLQWRCVLCEPCLCIVSQTVSG